MTTWVALLRGINVGRAKRIAMADLRALLEGLGYENVRTALNSGNAVFTDSSRSGALLERDIGTRIARDLDMDVRVLVRSGREVATVLDNNPFVPRHAKPKEMGVTFLSAAPARGKLAALDPAGFGPDEFEFAKREIYTRQPNGVMGTRLPDWEKVLGVGATARNWNTVIRLAELAAE
jgi:uncharacterized protein (DUF1697 family)